MKQRTEKVKGQKQIFAVYLGAHGVGHLNLPVQLCMCATE